VFGLGVVRFDSVDFFGGVYLCNDDMLCDRFLERVYMPSMSSYSFFVCEFGFVV
jgi:hypothetical protein